MSYSALLDAASAPAWKPSPGDKLIGIVTDLDLYEGEYGEPTPVLSIETVADPEGKSQSTLEGSPIPVGEEFRVFGFGTVLRKEIAKLEPQFGDLVGVKYVGVSENAKPGQHPARIFRFKVFERASYLQGQHALYANDPLSENATAEATPDTADANDGSLPESESTLSLPDPAKDEPF